MKILVLSWKYPPLTCGGLARHVEALSENIVKKGHEVHVITENNNELEEYSEKNGVKIHRSPNAIINSNNFISEILHLNFQLLEKANQVINKEGDFSLIHAHDWLVFWAAKVLKHSYDLALIYTIHATERGRNNGIYNDMQSYINDVEWYSTFEAWKVIACSQYMREEIKNNFQLPEDKITVINNGVKVEEFEIKIEKDFKKNYVFENEKLIFYVGRLVREKGIENLLEAFSIALRDDFNLKLVIAGKGPYENKLKEMAYKLNISDKVIFTGFISDEIRNKLYKIADLAVFPSTYEPFGIVALEAMAAKTPLISSNAGGFNEFIKDGYNALKFEAGDSYDLAAAILRTFRNEREAGLRAERAYKEIIDNFNWEKIAEQSISLYKEVLSNAKEELRK
ncbi:MAG: glycosyltransferase family 4 protein [Bacillota bacterium]